MKTTTMTMPACPALVRSAAVRDLLERAQREAEARIWAEADRRPEPRAEFALD